MRNIYALNENTEIISYSNGEVHLGAHTYGKGRGVYIAGLPYSTQNTRVLLRSLYYAAHKEEEFKKWYADNNMYAILNNTNQEQKTNVYDGEGNHVAVTLAPGEIRWMVINDGK